MPVKNPSAVDAFTRKHLSAWVQDQFEHTNEVEEKLEVILDFLSNQDADDLEHWLGRTWWEVLTNAEFVSQMRATCEPR